MTVTPAVSRSGAAERLAQPTQVAAHWLALCTVQCAWCPRVYVRPGSFAGLYAAAAADGWRTDGLCQYWSCPGCQAKPGWWAPNRPAPAPQPARGRRPGPGLEHDPHARAAGTMLSLADHGGIRERPRRGYPPAARTPGGGNRAGDRRITREPEGDIVAGRRGGSAAPGDTMPMRIPGPPWPDPRAAVWT
jgi:hypothetical protein